jgi:hypothetical protein
MRSYPWLCFVASLFLVTTIVACGDTSDSRGDGETVEIPSERHIDLVRLSNGELLVQTDYWTFYSLGKQQFIEIDLPQNSLCTRRTDYHFPTGLPDGRLGLLERCLGRWPDRVPGRDDADYIVAYDWQTAALEQLVDTGLPGGWAGRFSWNPTMTRGVQGFGSLEGTIAWITPSGLLPMTVTIGTRDKSWSLDENFETFGVLYDTYEVGIAQRPAWSPDGEAIAFWASTSVIGQSGHARARGTYSLYLLHTDTLALQAILDSVRDPERAVWSPDSRLLLFQGSVNDRDGLWLIARDGTMLGQLANGRMRAWEWLNDREIIAIYCLDDVWPCEETRLLKFHAKRDT